MYSVPMHSLPKTINTCKNLL